MDELIKQKIYAHPEMRRIPVAYQALAMRAFEEVMDDMQKHSRPTKKAASKKEGGEGNE